MVSLSNHVAISLRLSTCRGTIIATATRLSPSYQARGRNDMRKTGKARLPAASAIAFRLLLPCYARSPLPSFPQKSVIPAKAGIQCPKSPVSLPMPSFCGLWIPAVAGMTVGFISHCDPVLDTGMAIPSRTTPKNPVHPVHPGKTRPHPAHPEPVEGSS